MLRGDSAQLNTRQRRNASPLLRKYIFKDIPAHQEALIASHSGIHFPLWYFTSTVTSSHHRRPAEARATGSAHGVHVRLSEKDGSSCLSNIDMKFLIRFLNFFAGAWRQHTRPLPPPGVQRLPGGGLGGVPPVQRGPGEVPLLRGAESAGLQHQAVPSVPDVHHAEGAAPGPLGAQVQGQWRGTLAV